MVYLTYFKKNGFAAIVPGSTDDSEAWHRIMSDDPDEIMPPPESKKEMTEEEKEIITKWIEQGAKWEGHWSYLPVTKPSIPETSDKNWAKNEIDHFILSKLDGLGMKPSPEADRRPHPPASTSTLPASPPDLQRLTNICMINPPTPMKKWSIACSHPMSTPNG